MCPFCDSDSDTQVLLGVLGTLAWFRCAHCGADHYTPAEEASDETPIHD